MEIRTNLVPYSQILRQSEQAEHQPHLLPVFKSTIGVVFLGCPHRGADLAQWGVILGHLSTIALGSANKKLLRSLQTDGEMLDVINTAFARYLKDDKFSVYSFYEEKGMVRQHGIMGKVRILIYLFLYQLTNGLLGCTTILLCYW
jgi:hypothetical protein